MQKEILRCRACNAPFHYEKTRNWFGRNFLFFLPIKRFFCAKCARSRYRLITDAKLKRRYHGV